MHHVSLALLEAARVLAQLPLIVGELARSCVILHGLLRCRPLGEREVPVLIVLRRWRSRLAVRQCDARLVADSMPLLTRTVTKVLEHHALLIRAARRVASAALYLVSGEARRTRGVGPRNKCLIRK